MWVGVEMSNEMQGLIIFGIILWTMVVFVLGMCLGYYIVNNYKKMRHWDE